MDGSVGCCDERAQALVGGRVLRVVEAEHRERRLDGLDVLLGLGDARLRPPCSTSCGTMTAASRPMMTTTTMISMSVKPRCGAPRRGSANLTAKQCVRP